jgi:hypothetical protein
MIYAVSGSGVQLTENKNNKQRRTNAILVVPKNFVNSNACVISDI